MVPDTFLFIDGNEANDQRMRHGAVTLVLT